MNQVLRIWHLLVLYKHIKVIAFFNHVLEFASVTYINDSIFGGLAEEGQPL